MVRMLFLMVGWLTFLFSGLALAQDQRFGDWAVDTKNASNLYAASTNDSGHVLGQYCYPTQGTCVWLIAIRTACDKDHKYPALANSDAGSAQLELLCLGRLESTEYHQYAFTSFDQVDNFVRAATNRVGGRGPVAVENGNGAFFR
jgi:hypothetical protein